ncbi:potassium transporter TrkA [Dactylosporangium sp. NPDC005555]|uniref:potassium transporter TrkA n=1 Tax=Dactylosporangium sp. NPDC005555 TaxID=3154889 RepID=UPI0033B06D00
MDVELTPLPGIGLQHIFTTASGRRVGVVTHHTGDRRELVHGVTTDPDRMCSLTLTRNEALILARLLDELHVVDVTVTEQTSAGCSCRRDS